MKDREVTILMNDLAADYDMFRMKEKPGKIRSLKRNLSQRSPRRYAARILKVTERSLFQLVLIPFLVCANSDSTTAHRQSLRSVGGFFEMPTLRAAQSLQIPALANRQRHAAFVRENL